MKVLFLCGDHPRHLYIARRLAEAGVLAGLGIEVREEHFPSPPDHLSEDLKKLFLEHFTKRDEAEAKHFGQAALTDQISATTVRFPLAELNTATVTDLIDEVAPDLLLSYGVHKLSPRTLEHAKGERWNIHGGLSPQYRGAITHFWPSYMLEPQMTGMTVHNLTAQLDAGDVVHQVSSPLIRHDGLHDLAARSVLALANDLPKVIEKAEEFLERGDVVPKIQQRGVGKLWLASEWRPDHLRLIYDTWNDQIVDACLDGKIEGRTPVLHSILSD